MTDTTIDNQIADQPDDHPDDHPDDQTVAGSAVRGLESDRVQQAHREVLIAVQRGLAAHWERDYPRIAVVEQNDIVTVYVSTVRNLDPRTRSDIRGAVRVALADYVPLAPYTNVVFLRRGMP